MSTIDASSSLSMQDYFSTTLSSTISSTDTVLTLASVPTASEGFLVLELGTANQELIYYNSKGVSTVTCPSAARGRGVGGTTAVGHTSGASIKQVINADFWKELQNGNANTGMQTYFDEGFYDYVALGCVWTGDSLGSTRVASMTAGTVYISGKRLVVAAVTSRTFTASKDTYIDITTTSGSNAGTVVYTEVANNAASPALAASSVRIGIIVTGATTIAAAGSINQGDPACVLPIASSTPYAFTDSLGNLICNRDANPTVIGWRQVVANQGSITTQTDATGLSVPIIVPTGRKIRIKGYALVQNTNAGTHAAVYLFEGAAQLQADQVYAGEAAVPYAGKPELTLMPSAGLHTYKLVLAVNANTLTLAAAASQPAFIAVELV